MDPPTGSLTGRPTGQRELLPWWAGPVTDPNGGPVLTGPDVAAWVLGVHGGAAATAVVTLFGGRVADAHRRWPDPRFGGPSPVVLVGRLSALGLRRLRMAARQWAAGDVPTGVGLLGAVVTAAAPGRTPRALLAELDRLRVVVPAVAVLAWRADLVTAVLGPGEPAPPALGALLAAAPPPASRTAPPVSRADRHQVHRWSHRSPSREV